MPSETDPLLLRSLVGGDAAGMLCLAGIGVVGRRPVQSASQNYVAMCEVRRRPARGVFEPPVSEGVNPHLQACRGQPMA